MLYQKARRANPITIKTRCQGKREGIIARSLANRDRTIKLIGLILLNSSFITHRIMEEKVATEGDKGSNGEMITDRHRTIILDQSTTEEGISYQITGTFQKQECDLAIRAITVTKPPRMLM